MAQTLQQTDKGSHVFDEVDFLPPPLDENDTSFDIIIGVFRFPNSSPWAQFNHVFRRFYPNSLQRSKLWYGVQIAFETLRTVKVTTTQHLHTIEKTL